MPPAELGEGLLVRLYNTRNKLEGPNKPSFLTDPALQKVLAALVRKFPELATDVEKVQGYDIFASKAAQLYAELEPDYETFIDVVEWNRTVQNVLTEITNSLSSLQWDENPILTQGYMDLIVVFLQLQILVTLVNDRRTLVTVFERLYFIVKNSKENNFGKVAQYIARYAEPFKKLPEVMKPFGKKITQAILSVSQAFAQVQDLQFLRKDGTLNITLNPDKIALPTQDTTHLNFLVREKLTLWITWGFLFIPEELSAMGALPLIKTALTQSWRLPVFRDLTVPIHDLYTTSWKSFKSKTFKLGKEAKAIADCANASASGEGADLHKSFRIFLRQSLQNLLCLFKDFPGLLGPKMTLLWSALCAAKSEVLWYFRHYGSQPPKTKAKFLPENFRDKNISELIYLSTQLIQLIRQHQRIVQAYYLEYLQGADLLDFEKQIGKLSTTGDCGPILQDIVRELRTIDVASFLSGSGPEYNFQALRLNWYRVEARLSATSGTITVSQAKELVNRGRLIYLHSRNVDMVEDQIDEFASLKQLWYFKDLFMEAFDKAVSEGPANPSYAMGFLQLLAEFPENVTPYYPEEKERVIGPECVKLAQSMLERITSAITNIIMEISNNYLAYNDQLKHDNAAYKLLTLQKDYKFDKNFVPPVTAGDESQYKTRVDIENLRLAERNIYQLCSAMQEFVDVAVYDHKFVPREFLREKLASALRSFINQAVVPDKQNNQIQRPSVLEVQFGVFFSTFKLVENYVDLDIGDVIREACLKQCYSKSLSDVNKIDWSVEGEIAWGTEVSLMKFISKWYGDFVSKRLTQPGVCYSANRKAFISRAAMQFKAEEYSDLAELQALCRLVGPYGVKAIDREIMRFIVENISGIKTVLRNNKSALEGIATNYHKDVSVQIKSIKAQDADEFVNRSISIGNALQFRALLHEAQKGILEVDVPYIYRVIQLIFEQYPRNTFMKPEFIEMDSLAASCGLDVGTADQALKGVLSKLVGEPDRSILKLLPYMYAASFLCSKVWGEAVYHSTIEAHSNNAHTMSLAINALLISVEASSGEGGEGDLINLIRKFVEASSCILLKQAQQPLKATEKLGIQSFPSIMIFMDKFIQESPLLTQDVLEEYMPYSLLRSMYKSLHEISKEKGKKVTQEEFHQ